MRATVFVRCAHVHTHPPHRPIIHDCLGNGGLQSLCLMHTGKPTGVAVSHCRTWFQTQLILTTCQICYRSHCGIIVALDSSEP